jgi:hypothetical protein
VTGTARANAPLRQKTGFRWFSARGTRIEPWVEHGKWRLKHFSNRGCERAGYAETMTTLCVHGRPSQSLAGEPRLRIAGRLRCRLSPVSAFRAEPRQSGDWRSQGRGSRCRESSAPLCQARLWLAPTISRLAAKRDKPSRKSWPCLWAPLHLVQNSRPRSAELPRNAAILPETTAAPSDAGLHNVQNSRPRSQERRPTLRPEITATHSETDLHNVQNSWPASPERVRNSAILPETTATPSETCLHNLRNS